MTEVAIAVLTKDRVALTRESARPLLKGAQDKLFDLFWFDGSATDEGQRLPKEMGGDICRSIYANVTGGPGIGIVTALHAMLHASHRYEYLGLVENDVLLKDDWFHSTMGLFDVGEVIKLPVGAVSARAYEDRVLVQDHDDYAVMHDLGAGMIIFTREAAQQVLHTFRAGWTTDNRRAFQRLSGIDIGRYWAFNFAEHWLTADWHWGVALACRGLSMLALTPSPVEMIGQEPLLAEQGLTLTTGPVNAREDVGVFRDFAANLNLVRNGRLNLNIDPALARNPADGATTVMAHQIGFIGGSYNDKWAMRDARHFGPFTFTATEAGAEVCFNACGPINVLVSGGEKGAALEIGDASGFSVAPELPASPDGKAIMNIAVPGNIASRALRIRALTPGGRLHCIQLREPPLLWPNFDVAKFMCEMPAG